MLQMINNDYKEVHVGKIVSTKRIQKQMSECIYLYIHIESTSQQS